MQQMTAQFFTSAQQVGKDLWCSVFDAKSDPFSRYEFIHALEESGCVSAKTGWQPYHLGLYRQDTLVALCIGYIKSHSYGEYVFDWAIAQAYEDHGFDYYPKWICAIPFTPVTGQRIAIADGIDSQQALHGIKAALEHQGAQQGWSGWHINFCEPELADALERLSCSRRKTVQFQWQNHNYQSFEDFCQHLKSRKRKSIIKERRAVADAHLHIEVLCADDITSEHMTLLSRFYQRTYLKRSGHLGYLSPRFFTLLWQSMRSNLVVICASKSEDSTPVAASLFVRDDDTLYGRYWGCSEHYDHLHFELCYYQGIDYCIKHRLSYFNGGAQGEHKIARGFTPLYTHSCHYFLDSPFTEAIDDFFARENAQHNLYRQDCEKLSPYKME
ncbi:GNAT family N-acetyltransferase [Pseudoalteromonas sp. SSDWG2]|uniref:GNAT family N-acetyltransferase n=1 Tax=Pseudoalteromonas sp. SSDWG2 TaxID=3139391 RepID=UPI003BA9A59A